MPADPSCQTSGMKTQIEFQLFGMGIWIHLKIGYNWLHFLHKDLLQNKIAILEHSHFWTNPYTMLLLGFPRHLDTHTHTWQKWELMASYPLLCLRPHSGSMDLFMVFVHWSIKLLQPELELDDLGLTIRSSRLKTHWRWNQPLFHSPVPHLLLFYPWFWADWHSQSLFFSTYICIYIYMFPCLRAQPSESCKVNRAVPHFWDDPQYIFWYTE